MRSGVGWEQDPETDRAVAEWRMVWSRRMRFVRWLIPLIVANAVAQGNYLYLAFFSVGLILLSYVVFVTAPARMRRDPAYREKMLQTLKNPFLPVGAARPHKVAGSAKPAKMGRSHRLADWLLLLLAVILLMAAIGLVLVAPYAQVLVPPPNPAAPPLPDSQALQFFVGALTVLLLYGARGIWRERFLVGSSLLLAGQGTVLAIELSLGWLDNSGGGVTVAVVLLLVSAAAALGIRHLVLRWQAKASKRTQRPPHSF